MNDNEDDGEYVELPAWAIKVMIAATLVVLCVIGLVWRMVR